MNRVCWGIPLLCLLFLVSPWIDHWDLVISNFFYEPDSTAFSKDPLYSFLFKYGPYPALLVGVGSLFCYLSSFFVSRLKKWRITALYLGLTLGIGSGLIIHVLKDHWGRPRPRQIKEFGGDQTFRPYYSPDFSSNLKSFPSGHASMGFYFFSLALLGKQWDKPSLFWIGILFAILLGIAISIARIAVGGHFFSDTLVSAFIMWFVASLLGYFCFSLREKSGCK